MREECGKYGEYGIQRLSELFRTITIVSDLAYSPGTVTSLVIPRPSSSSDEVPGVGMVRGFLSDSVVHEFGLVFRLLVVCQVFVEYADTQGSARAKSTLHGRKFGGNSVIASFYAEEKFAQGDFGS